jgi:hypothetical protein
LSLTAEIGIGKKGRLTLRKTRYEKRCVDGLWGFPYDGKSRAEWAVSLSATFPVVNPAASLSGFFLCREHRQ